LFAYRQGLVAATSFPALASFTFVLYVVLGGIASRPGVAAATTVFVLVTAFKIPLLRGDLVTSLGALGLILTIGAHPEGIGGQVREALARRRRRTAAPGAEAGLTAAAVPVPVSKQAPQRAPSSADVPLIQADDL